MFFHQFKGLSVNKTEASLLYRSISASTPMRESAPVTLSVKDSPRRSTSAAFLQGSDCSSSAPCDVCRPSPDSLGAASFVGSLYLALLSHVAS